MTGESREPGEVRLKMPFRPVLTQQHGFFHAGGTSALADTAGGYAGFTLFPQDSSVLTVEFKINLVAPARGDYLEAVGKVLRSGRTLRSEEHTSELQSLMRISYAVFCLKKKKKQTPKAKRDR